MSLFSFSRLYYKVNIIDISTHLEIKILNLDNYFIFFVTHLMQKLKIEWKRTLL